MSSRTTKQQYEYRAVHQLDTEAETAAWRPLHQQAYTNIQSVRRVIGSHKEWQKAQNRHHLNMGRSDMARTWRYKIQRRPVAEWEDF